MKKNFKYYVFSWVVLLGLFNLFAFIIPSLPNAEKFTASFWIGWGVTTAAFFGQLVCSYIAFKEGSAKKTFYNVSLFTTSYTGLIITAIVGIICIVITSLPYWIAAIVCATVFVVNAIAVAKAKVAINLVVAVDKKVEKATTSIYEMREESESLLARAKTDNIKDVCKKVRDAFKFSDPMSNANLSTVDGEIKTHFDILKKAVVEEDLAVITSESDEVLTLIAERNNKCKRLK